MTENEVAQQIYQWWLNDETTQTCPGNIPNLTNHCELNNCRECKLIAVQEAAQKEKTE